MSNNPYRIELGIGLNDTDFKNLQTKIKGLEDEVKINLNIKDADNKIESLQKSLKNLGKDSSDNIFNINTKSLTDSLETVKKAVVDIKETFGSLDNKLNTRDLVTSVNQIATALGKAESESDSLVSSLKALSQKNFDVSIDLKMGGSKNNPVKNNQAFGEYARKTVLPQLEKQLSGYGDIISDYVLKNFGRTSNSGVEAIQALVRRAENEGKMMAGSSGFYLSSLQDISSTTITTKLEAYLALLVESQKAAEAFGISLSGVDNKFSQSSEDLVQKAFDIKNGIQQATDEVDKLKSVFGGIDADGLKGVLEPIEQDLKEIKQAFEALSSIGTIDGLTTSFKELSGVLEKLSSNITVVKQNLDGIGNVGASAGQSSGVENLENGLKQVEDVAEGAKQAVKQVDDAVDSVGTDAGVENLEQDLKQVENSAEQAAGAIKQISDAGKGNTGLENVENDAKEITSTIDVADNSIDGLKKTLAELGVNSTGIDLVVKDIQEMGMEIQKVKTEISGNNLKLSITGLKEAEDGVKRVANEIKTFPDAISNPENIKRSVTETFETSADKAKQEVKEINDAFKEVLDAKKQIGKIETQLISETDINKIQTALDEIDRYQKKIDSIDTSKFTKQQNEELEELEKSIKYSQEQKLNDLEIEFSADKAKQEAEEINDAYTKIYNTRKQIGSLEVDLIGAKAKDDAKAIEDINNEIARLKSNLATLEEGNIGAKFSDEQKANLKELRKQIQYDKKQEQNAVDYKANAQEEKAEAKRINDVYNDIYNTKKKIGSLEVDLIKAEDARDAQNIRNEIERLQKSLALLDADGSYGSKFSNKQKDSLKELEEQIKFNKKQAENKVDIKLEAQIDKEDSEKVKQETKEIEKSFKELKRLAMDMGKVDIELAGLTEADKDFNSLKRHAEELEVEFDVLYEKIGKNLNADQVKELDQIFANTTGAVRELNNELSETAEAKELTSGLERLESITKEIAQLNVDIFKFDDVDNIERATNRLNELENEAVELRAELSKKLPSTAFDEIDDIANRGKKALDDLINKAAEAKAKLAESIKVDIEVGKYDNDISGMYDKFNKLSGASKELRESVEAVESAYREMEIAAQGTGDEAADRERLIQAEKEYAAALEKANNLIRIQAREQKAADAAQNLDNDIRLFQSNIDGWLTKNSAAAKTFGSALIKLRDSAEGVDRVTLNHLIKQFNLADKAADKAGLKMESTLDKIKNKFKEYSAYFSVAEVFMYAEQALRDMFEQVKAIDTAMTELKKVTDETDSSYNRFLSNAASRAKEIGTTIDGLVTSTADFARLGYDFDESAGLAEVANIYAVVGDDIEGVEDATQSLVSTLTAFKKEANGLSDSDFALSIVDKMNEVSNNFAISSGGIGEALQRSASSMSAANNSLDETIALITAANTVVQDPASVGTAFKTISMRIRGAKTELEEAGLETDGMAESTASLRQEIMALSGVDIMLDSSTFKSTYQIMEELSAKWQNLTDIQQASVTELIAGKRQGNIVSSLMENFDIAQNALQTSLKSSGSAMEEHAKWSDSIEARLLKLKATWQSFAQTFMSSDFLKGGITVLSKIVDILDKLIDNFGLLGTLGLGTTIFGVFKAMNSDVTKTVTGLSDVVNAIENIASAISNMPKVAIDTVGIVETASNTVEIIGETVDTVTDGVESVENFAKVTDEVSKISNGAIDAIDGVADSLGKTVKPASNSSEAMLNLKDATLKTNGGLKAFMKTPLGVATAIGLIVAAVGFAINAYKKYREEISAARQETIKSSDEFLDAASNFEQAYIKYSGKTNLTAQEESELENAIQGTVSALGDKSSALKDVVNSSNDYVQSLERIAEEELKQAERAAKNKRDNAELELIDTAMGWASWEGSEIDIVLSNDLNDNVTSIAKNLGSDFFVEQTVDKDNGWKTGFTGFVLPKDADVNDIVNYYNELVEFREALADKDLIDTTEYSNVNEIIGKLSDSVKVYTDGVYDAAKAQYQLANGIPKTTEEYLRMREAILKNDDLEGLSVDTLKTVANTLDSEYGKSFDLSTAEAQSRKLIGILDNYGDVEAGQIESLLNMRTAVNGNECTVGEYLSQFDKINAMTIGWSKEDKTELNTSFGLDTDKIKEQYDEAFKYISRNYLNKLDTSGMLRFEAEEYRSSETERIKSLLKNLSANELTALINIKTEIDWGSSSKDDILAQIKKEAKFVEAMSFTIPIDIEVESLDALNTAMAESVSATGLSSESIAALEGRYSELESKGYDLSSMFEETSNGIHLNREAVDELERAYASEKLSETKENIGVLKERYDELTEEINNCSDASERAALYKEQETIVQKINDLGTLAAQYEGLASAYNAWQNAESSGNERDMYESVIEGFETVGDEIKRGWYDDGTIKFLELMTGQTDLASKSASELKEIWKGLDENIKNTSYSVRDFFTVDEDGNSTSTGVYNFLKALQELESSDTKSSVLGKAFKDIENIKDLVTVKDGKITAFNFEVVGGDEAIAEALGISEELVQIMLRAADDAGFVVTIDGTWTQFADLQQQAEEANESIKKLAQTNEHLKNAGFGNYEFKFSADNIDTLNEDLDKAKQLLNSPAFKNAKGEFDINAEGAREALKIAETLQITINKLKEPAYMSVEVEELQKDMQEPVRLLQEYEKTAQTLSLLKLTPDINKVEIKELETGLNNIAEQLYNLGEETKIKLGIEGKTPEQIRKELENGTIEIPTELTIEANMDKSLEDLVTLGLLEQGLITESEARVRLGIKAEVETVDTSEIENAFDEAELNKDQEVKILAMAEVLGAEDVESLDEKLSNLDDEQIQVLAAVLGRIDVERLKYSVSELDDKSIEAIAKAIGEGDVEGLKTALLNIPDKTVANAIAKAFGYNDVSELASAVGGMDDNTVLAIAKAFGITDVDSLVNAVNRLTDNNVTASATVSGEDEVDSLRGAINSLTDKSVTIWAQIKKIGSDLWGWLTGGGGGAGPRKVVNGTANVDGAAFASGTVGNSGKAFSRGNWRTKKTETALTGELGRRKFCDHT